MGRIRAQKRREVREQETVIKVDGSQVAPNARKEPEDEMTQEELREYLDSVIRRTARWRVTSQEAPFFSSDNAELLDKVSGRVYDSMVQEYSWNRLLLMATRTADFSKEYVRRTIRQGLYSGILEVNEDTIRESERIADGVVGGDSFTEAIQKLACVVAREEMDR